jgi:hypothetical protein
VAWEGDDGSDTEIFRAVPRSDGDTDGYCAGSGCPLPLDCNDSKPAAQKNEIGVRSVSADGRGGTQMVDEARHVHYGVLALEKACEQEKAAPDLTHKGIMESG